MSLIFLTLLIIFSADFAACVIYQWVDMHGGVHYTDDFITIPEKYRFGIKKMEIREQDQVPKAEYGPKNSESIYTDRLGRGEQYWRTQVKEWNNKSKSLQDKNENLRVKHNDLTVRYNDSRNSVERAAIRKERDRMKQEMDQKKGDVDAAKVMLEKRIPEEAEFYKAKPEWVKW